MRSVLNLQSMATGGTVQPMASTLSHRNCSTRTSWISWRNC